MYGYGIDIIDVDRALYIGGMTVETIPGLAIGVSVVNCALEQVVGVHEVKKTGPFSWLMPSQYVFHQTGEPKILASEACSNLSEPKDAEVDPEAVEAWIAYSSQFGIVNGGAVCGAKCIYRRKGAYNKQAKKVYENVTQNPLEHIPE